ncbi:MAG: hypothetical protein V4629_03665 [Pseudomonadota bacterium]
MTQKQSDALAEFFHAPSYIAFVIPAETKRNVDTLKEWASNRTEDNKNEMKEIQSLFADVVMVLVSKTMEIFFLDPLEPIGLGNVGQKMVRTCVSTVTKAISFLLHSVGRRLSAQELESLILYLYGTLLWRKSNDGVSIPYLGCPLNQEFTTSLENIKTKSEQGQGQEVCDGFSDILLDVSDHSMEIFFIEPLKLLKLNMVFRKTADVAVDTTRAAIHKIIRHIFKDMNNDQMRQVSAYIRPLHIDGNEFERRS